MKKYYVVIAVLIGILGLMYFQCSSSSSSSNVSSDPSTSKSGVNVTYYFNPGCPHCRNFIPTWKEFVVDGGANFTEINCSTNPEKCRGVRGVPWIVFSKGEGSPAIPFTGNRDKQSLRAFLNTMN